MQRVSHIQMRLAYVLPLFFSLLVSGEVSLLKGCAAPTGASARRSSQSGPEKGEVQWIRRLLQPYASLASGGAPLGSAEEVVDKERGEGGFRVTKRHRENGRPSSHSTAVARDMSVIFFCACGSGIAMMFLSALTLAVLPLSLPHPTSFLFHVLPYAHAHMHVVGVRQRNV